MSRYGWEIDMKSTLEQEEKKQASLFSAGVRLPGKATHYQPENDGITLCGRVGVEYKTDKKKEVDCFHCRRTKAWRAI